MDTFKVEITKIDETREVDFAALTEEVQRYVIGYGLKQIFNDAHAQCKKYVGKGDDRTLNPAFNADEVRGLVDKKLDALRAGDLSRERASKTVGGDTLPSMMLDIAIEEIRAGLAKAGIKLKVVELKERAKARVTRDEARIRAKAETRLAELAALADDIDF